ncbi:MAG TPA: methylmalonyl-CoA epimerase [Bryobacteraceae bacterium]|nr:methylmalonyl-CoA epimerase [Bryobacteraceae bacterium]
MSPRELAKLATAVENGEPLPPDLPAGEGLIIGITGPAGAGKSSLASALVTEIRKRGKTVAVVAVDPSSRATGGAILGDRIRMQAHHGDSGVFVRSMATRGSQGGIARTSLPLARLFRGAGFDFVLLETVGAGQDEIDIAASADVTLVVLMPGMGDEVQAIKAGMMEIADIFVINKADRPGVEQTVADLEAAVPVFRTVAIGDTGIAELLDEIAARTRRQGIAPDPQWKVDHIGVAVESLAESLPFYTGQLAMRLLAEETVAAEQVRVAMLDAGQSRIELLEPTNPGSTIAKFLAKRGPGLHHVAMRTADLTAAVERLRAAGAKLLNEPRRGAGGHLYVFVHPGSAGGVLWEIIQES